MLTPYLQLKSKKTNYEETTFPFDRHQHCKIWNALGNIQSSAKIDDGAKGDGDVSCKTQLTNSKGEQEFNSIKTKNQCLRGPWEDEIHLPSKSSSGSSWSQQNYQEYNAKSFLHVYVSICCHINANNRSIHPTPYS